MLAETRETVRRIWRRILNVGEVEDGDNFFMLGGDSLMANMMLVAVGETLASDLSVVHLYENPTLAGFSRAVETMKADGEEGQAAESRRRG